VIASAVVAIWATIDNDPFAPLYADNCSVCHGESYEGTAQGPALVGKDLVHGELVAEIAQSIATGFPDKGMPAWSATLNDGEIRSLAIMIAEKRVNRTFTDFKVDKRLEIPRDAIETELVSFRIETVATGLDPLPFSIAPLPDGRILLTEKIRGLSIISADGELSEPIAGTPQTSDFGINILGLDYGVGWLLDVVPHPDYPTNGWIYLLHTDLCSNCKAGGSALLPTTMIRVVRGHINEGIWEDEEVIWRVSEDFYTTVPDIAAGGRLAFDPDGYLYLSVGMKGMGNYVGIQDLSTPYGKVHRVHDDGRVPLDNPFITLQDAQPSIWTYGHRSPQGLEFDAESGQLWGTEMGPQGGDEVNLLRPGRNYGWPLYSKGVDYDGTPVEYGKELRIEFDLEDIEQPVVDLTPSPAVSSFIVYGGEAFPEWRGHLIVGSLKATELYRFVVDGDQHVHSEILLEDLARIRDVESGPDGMIYLLLEHEAGSQIVRLSPAPGRQHGNAQAGR
jgi:glucose/arabinose dehydrogenase